MKANATMMLAAALLALTACDRLGIGGGGTANDSATASANSAGEAGNGVAGGNQAEAGLGGKDPAGATQASAGGTGVTLDRAYIAGRWTDNGDCSVAVEFTDDGRFVANNGSEGLWNLAGDRLTMQGERTLTLQIVPIDQNVMNVVNPNGSLGRSTRC